MRFGIEFVPYQPFWKTTFYAIQAEKRGFEYIWITDHYNNRNVYVTLATIALHTSKINLGIGVTNPYLVNPVITAQAAASLSEIAPNRVILGVGPGDKTTLASLGVDMVLPVAAVKECVLIARSLFEKGKVKFEGKVFKVPSATFYFKVKGKIPIYIGAQGPQMLKIAAKYGDGVLINASHPKDIEEAMKHLKKGAKAAGKTLEDIEIVAYTSLSIDEDLDKALKAASRVVAFIVAGSPEFILKRHGIDVGEANEIKKALGEARWKDAFSMVNQKMIDAFSITGTPEMCIKKIEELAKIGVNQIVAGSPIGPNVRKSIDLFSEKVIEAFK
ncbi:MAG: 5,10-methylenetetrahydromethanopterin reductase [Candidatus Methanomethylicota archaeon]|uniref:5,10-methylenetetrahydromethanopterin reductase n=1 Tax=Thermoproteota archaeon TaxID=2056631 RepID=A0A497F597_9CREN|nr:MAG: 5,10-methylenetetrahydromethanopterin reductase [Candidatus Verstraetearchaeota archaeon]